MVFPKTELFIRVKQKFKMFKNRTLVEADPGSLPTAKIELFATIVYDSKPYINVLSQGVQS